MAITGGIYLEDKLSIKMDQFFPQGMVGLVAVISRRLESKNIPLRIWQTTEKQGRDFR